eukprot:SAG11_NODE_468_length_9209_cov_21.950604_2_plen_175_part_00
MLFFGSEDLEVEPVQLSISSRARGPWRARSESFASLHHTLLTVSSHMPVKWGIMGTASIAGSVFEAMKTAPSAECVAIASRTDKKAATWAAERGIPKSYGSYAALLADAEIDAVYIPLPTTLHLEWVVKAAEAGKHVLVEKPVGVCEADVRTMTNALSSRNVREKLQRGCRTLP